MRVWIWVGGRMKARAGLTLDKARGVASSGPGLESASASDCQARGLAGWSRLERARAGLSRQSRPKPAFLSEALFRGTRAVEAPRGGPGAQARAGSQRSRGSSRGQSACIASRSLTRAIEALLPRGQRPDKRNETNERTKRVVEAPRGMAWHGPNKRNDRDRTHTSGRTRIRGLAAGEGFHAILAMHARLPFPFPLHRALASPPPPPPPRWARRTRERMPSKPRGAYERTSGRTRLWSGAGGGG